ncbi:MAG: pyridoxal phosphate-dependent aminotransferase family protein [Bacteroidales bacterium]|jgi:7-keto-8-aminopelargonate synthetase-like enzyme|nr:pyridoxal phosphate-dependent aminotransferase family protein [Bacteroidales bacterium]
MVILEGGIGNYVNSKGRRFSYFGGNNYLGLANHPAVKNAVIQAVRKYGINFSASRRTSGTATIHLELENELSLFKGKEDTVVFASGYQGNSILLEILKDKYSIVLADQLAHASISAAIPRDVNKMFFNHSDAGHLDYLITHNKISNPLIITDGVFALTGEIAPLDKIFPVVRKHKGLLVVDDAHATGVLGKTGKGTPEHFNLTDAENIYQTETMSKAIGGYGGFISGSRELTQLIREKSTTYQASTALPPPVVAAGIASLKIIHENPGLRIHLLEQADRLREEILLLGFGTTGNGTPVIPLIMSSPERAKKLSLFLEDNRIIVPHLNYPSNREMNILRIAVTASHSDVQIKKLLVNLKKWIKENGKD